MGKKMLYQPGDVVATFTGDIGIVVSRDILASMRDRFTEGNRPGRFFSPGCCHNPDYVTQIPIFFEDGTFDVMRAMNIRKGTDIPEEKKRQLLAAMGADEDQMRRRDEMEDCIFCKIVKGEIPCFKVYEDDRVLAFEDINPISEGHTLIIPKRHARDLWEIPEEDLAAIYAASKKVGIAIRKSLDPAGIAVLQLNGRGVNQVVMHYHLHLMPRQADRPELPVTVWELKQGDMESIKKTAEKIAGALGK